MDRPQLHADVLGEDVLVFLAKLSCGTLELREVGYYGTLLFNLEEFSCRYSLFVYIAKDLLNTALEFCEILEVS